MYRHYLRPGWIVGHLMVVLSVLVCLRLGLWQWHRFHDSDGTVQNLGYTVLWPVFGGAFIYMWLRFLQLETIKDAQENDELIALAAGDRPVGSAAADLGWSTNGTTFEPADRAQPDLTPSHVGSSSADRPPGENPSLDVALDPAEEPDTPPSATIATEPRRTPSRDYMVAVATVGDENEDQDPELAAYNRALAALAEKDHRRAR